MSDARPASGAGLLGSLKSLAATLVAAGRTRLEILATEIEEEKLRLGQVLVLAFVGLFFLCLGVVFLAGFLTVLLWDTHRLFVLGAFTLIFLIGGAAAIGLALSKSRQKRRLFADSLAELARDQQQLSS